MLRAKLLGLRLVNVLHQDTLVLENVTLRLKVKLVVPRLLVAFKQFNVQVLVDLTSLTVLPKEAAQHTLAAHPLNLGREAGLGGTLALTVTSVATDTLGSMQVTSALARVRHKRLLDDLTILDQLANIRARVGVRNVALLSRVEPDLTLTDTEDGRSQTPLHTKINHDCNVLVPQARQRESQILTSNLRACWFVEKGREAGLVTKQAQKLCETMLGHLLGPLLDMVLKQIT